MHSDNVSPAEWRWVAILSGLFVTLTLLPYAWALVSSGGEYAFMGILSNPIDGATYLSKIEQGQDGAWLFELRHTPQSSTPSGFHLFYLGLGHIARLLGLSNVVIFHLARVATSFFMFAAIYQLGATIWHRLRPRRLFFLLVSMGSGLGWLVVVISPGTLSPDFNVPEAFPLLAAYTNPHFPLAIGCMALVAVQLLTVFRPGYQEAPNSDNGGLVLIVLSLVLAIVSPPAVISLSTALCGYILVRAYFLTDSKRARAKTGDLSKTDINSIAIRNFEIPWHEVRWAAMLILPAVPIALYYFFVFRFNEVMGDFNQQNQTPSPIIPLTLFGYGVLLLVAIPGLSRAFRRFEKDGDQFMLVWLLLAFVLVYLPFALQRRMYIGLIIPLAYFAVRAIEDYWIQHIPETRRGLAFILLFVLLLPTHFFTFGAPLAVALIDQDEGANSYILLDRDYIAIFDWFNANAARDEVVLAAPTVSLWIPAETDLRPVYGHPFETVPSEERLEQVQQFYRGEDCEALFNPDLPFRVRYVLWGRQEDRAGLITKDDSEELNLEDFDETAEIRLDTADLCREFITERALEQQEFGDVTLYILPNQ